MSNSCNRLSSIDWVTPGLVSAVIGWFGTLPFLVNNWPIGVEREGTVRLLSIYSLWTSVILSVSFRESFLHERVAHRHPRQRWSVKVDFQYSHSVARMLPEEEDADCPFRSCAMLFLVFPWQFSCRTSSPLFRKSTQWLSWMSLIQGMLTGHGRSRSVVWGVHCSRLPNDRIFRSRLSPDRHDTDEHWTSVVGFEQNATQTIKSLLVIQEEPTRSWSDSIFSRTLLVWWSWTTLWIRSTRRVWQLIDIQCSPTFQFRRFPKLNVPFDQITQLFRGKTDVVFHRLV